ncbi:dimethylarginine dimethylaminohydrolase family protein [Hyphomicrobium sp. MC8b]|uniref:dimethylarginine dimethylaminohydrolase family protein n=1 Tax=Hyphomicrobium sp. MC8b TaxID=300273 RepID=UPI00391C98B8
MSTTTVSIPWGLDSETGVLRHVLLGKPDFFEWRPVGAVSRQTLALGLRFDAQAAMSQHREMVDVFEQAGVTCHWLDARPELKYGVFARDSSVMTPFGAVITMLQTRYRRGDYALVLKFYEEAGIPIWNMITAGHFEGGDFMVVEPGFVLCGYGGERSEQEGAEQMCKWFREKGWEAYAVPFPPHFVHLDVSVGFINKKLVAVAPDAHQPWFLDLLKSKGYEILPVSYHDATQLGTNIVALGNDRVLSTAANEDLNARMRSHGIEVFDPDLRMFTLGGGGPHCLCQALRRDPL